jgi:hypothetical protein
MGLWYLDQISVNVAARRGVEYFAGRREHTFATDVLGATAGDLYAGA